MAKPTRAPIQNILNDSSPSQPSVTESVASGDPASSRVYRGTQEVDHDLFKLSVADMMKNASYTDRPEWQRVEHCHFFHTVDSGGRPQTTCTATGGHFHLVTVHHVPGQVPTLEISGPKRSAILKREGVSTRVNVDVEGDEHTHEAIYIRSDRINLRRPNAEFAVFETTVRQKREGSVDGVLG